MTHACLKYLHRMPSECHLSLDDTITLLAYNALVGEQNAS